MTGRVFSRLTIGRDCRGSVSVEFVIWTVVMFFSFLPILDFADFLIEEQDLSTAVTDATLVAYDQRSATSLNTSQLVSYVTASSGFATGQVSASLTCNGGLQDCSTPAANRTCACVSGSPATYTPSSSCGTPCTSGASSGFYLTVQAAHTHNSLLVDPFLDGSVVTSGLTVRLQ